MWILTTTFFMLVLGGLAVFGIRPDQLVLVPVVGPFLAVHPWLLGFVQLALLSQGYILSYLLLWIFGPVVDWFAADPSPSSDPAGHCGPFATLVQALSQPQRPATLPVCFLFLAPLGFIALWGGRRFDPVVLFMAVVIAFTAAQAIQPFSVRRCLRSIVDLPNRFFLEHIGIDLAIFLERVRQTHVSDLLRRRGGQQPPQQGYRAGPVRIDPQPDPDPAGSSTPYREPIRPDFWAGISGETEE